MREISFESITKSKAAVTNYYTADISTQCSDIATILTTISLFIINYESSRNFNSNPKLNLTTSLATHVGPMEATTEANDAALKYLNHKLSKNTQNLPHHPQQRHYTTRMHHYNKNDFSFNNNKQGAVPTTTTEGGSVLTLCFITLCLPQRQEWRRGSRAYCHNR